MVNCPLQLSEDAIKILGLLQGPQESHCSLHGFFGGFFVTKLWRISCRVKGPVQQLTMTLKMNTRKLTSVTSGFICLTWAHKQLCCHKPLQR